MCRTVMWCVVLFGSVKLCGGLGRGCCGRYVGVGGRK